MNVVAFLDADVHDTGRKLATDTILSDLYLTLDNLIGLSQSEETNDCHDEDGDGKS